MMKRVLLLALLAPTSAFARGQWHPLTSHVTSGGAMAVFCLIWFGVAAAAVYGVFKARREQDNADANLCAAIAVVAAGGLIGAYWFGGYALTASLVAFYIVTITGNKRNKGKL